MQYVKCKSCGYIYCQVGFYCAICKEYVPEPVAESSTPEPAAEQRRAELAERVAELRRQARKLEKEIGRL